MASAIGRLRLRDRDRVGIHPAAPKQGQDRGIQPFAEPGFSGLRGRGVGSWLVAHLAEWLRLGRSDRFLVALGEDELALEPWFARFGWVRVDRCRRTWERPVG